MSETHHALTTRELIQRYPTREAKIGRIREIEKHLEKMEMDDEHNDPKLIEGHIRLTRSYRAGCGVLLLCLMAMSYRVSGDGHPWATGLAYFFGIAGTLMILRGALYRPDPKLIEASYQPHRGTAEYRAVADELDLLARALSQDLKVEDAG